MALGPKEQMTAPPGRVVGGSGPANGMPREWQSDVVLAQGAVSSEKCTLLSSSSTSHLRLPAPRMRFLSAIAGFAALSSLVSANPHATFEDDPQAIRVPSFSADPKTSRTQTEP